MGEEVKKKKKKKPVLVKTKPTKPTTSSIDVYAQRMNERNRNYMRNSAADIQARSSGPIEDFTREYGLPTLAPGQNPLPGQTYADQYDVGLTGTPQPGRTVISRTGPNSTYQRPAAAQDYYAQSVPVQKLMEAQHPMAIQAQRKQILAERQSEALRKQAEAQAANKRKNFQEKVQKESDPTTHDPGYNYDVTQEVTSLLQKMFGGW